MLLALGPRVVFLRMDMGHMAHMHRSPPRGYCERGREPFGRPDLGLVTQSDWGPLGRAGGPAARLPPTCSMGCTAVYTVSPDLDRPIHT